MHSVAAFSMSVTQLCLDFGLGSEFKGIPRHLHPNVITFLDQSESTKYQEQSDFS